MTPNSIIVLILAATTVAQYELEYSFFEPGAELRRRYQIHEQRPHVMLTCTENTVIAELEYVLVPPANSSAETRPMTAVHRLGDSADPAVPSPTDPCPTLRRCLGYSGCTLQFSNEFCGRDPLLGSRKILNITVSCFTIEDTEPSKVVHLHYQSLLERGVRNYSSVKVQELEEDSRVVFGLTCPQGSAQLRRAGYRGQCSGRVADTIKLRERAGFIMSKVHSEECRSRMVSLLCALEFSNSAECLPPYMWEEYDTRESKNEGSEGEKSFDTYEGSEETGQDSSSVQHDHEDTARLSFQITPTVGDRPPTSEQTLSHPSLIPATLAFYIMVHGGAEATMALLRLVYNPAHVYVIHVDSRSGTVRDQLQLALEQEFPDRSRVRLLPQHRSFAADWGSDRVVRVQLECMEELLRMAAWDFAIPLSGTDLPLRSVVDLATTLAPYRGRNLIHPAEQKFMAPEEASRVFAMSGCDNFIFNASRPGNRTLQLKIPFYGQSMWAVLSRRFVQYVIEELPRPPLNRWSLAMRIIIIPDEHFFVTALMNSPLNYTLLRSKLHHPRRFEGSNADKLCRHQDVVEFCGKGPGTVEEKDMEHLEKSSSRFFFARKFSLDMKDPAREKFRVRFEKPFSGRVQHVFTSWLARYMAKISLKRLHGDMEISYDLIQSSQLQIYPSLSPISECCNVLHQRENQAVFSYAYIVDFTLGGHLTGSRFRSRVSVPPPVRCFPGGHLRSIRVTTHPAPFPPPFDANFNAPVPYLPAGEAALVVQLWFHAPDRWVAPEYAQCDRQLHRQPVVFQRLNVSARTAEPVRLRVQLREGRDVRCSRAAVVEWKVPSPRPGTPPWKRFDASMAFNITLACGHLAPGVRTLQLFSEDDTQPHSYEVPLLFASPLSEPSEDTSQFWRVEDVAPFGELGVTSQNSGRAKTTRQADEL